MSQSEPNPKPTIAGQNPGDLLAASLETEPATPAPASWEPPSPDELTPFFPGFDITAILGRGGMGAVYRATQLNLERQVAIKLLPAELGADPEFDARFKREAKSLAQLNHPNIVQIYDFGQTSAGHAYFVMEYVDGADLHQLIRSDGLDSQGSLKAISQICDALQYAHEKGYVHRDIKPANIFLNTDGIIKVGDFGLAKLTGSPNENAAPADQLDLTMSGVAMGTPHYIAPEQMDDSNAVDHRADLYSLGVMLYEMLTHEIPRGTVKPPSKRVENLDARVDGVVFKAMEQNPDERYQKATDLRSDVDVIRTSEGKAATKKAGMRPLAWAAVLIVLLLVGGLVWFSQQQASDSPQMVADSPAKLTPNPPVGAKANDDRPKNPFFREPSSELTFPLPQPERPKTPCRLVAWRLDGKPVVRDAFAKHCGFVPEDAGEVVDFSVSGVLEPENWASPIVLLADGTVRALNPEHAPFLPAGLKEVVRIDTSVNRAGAALRSDGTVAWWYGDGFQMNQHETWYAAVETWRDIVAIARGDHHLVALRADGTVVACGFVPPGEDPFEVPPGWDSGIEAIRPNIFVRREDSLISLIRNRDTRGLMEGQTLLLSDNNDFFLLGRNRSIQAASFGEVDPCHFAHIRGKKPENLTWVSKSAKQLPNKKQIGICAAREGEDEWHFWGDLGEICHLDEDYCRKAARGCWKVYPIPPYAIGLKPVFAVTPLSEQVENQDVRASHTSGTHSGEPSLPITADLHGETVTFHNSTRGGRDLPTTQVPAQATQSRPFENQLGMRFVPVAIAGGPTDGRRILFSIWETRVIDYERFLKEDRNRRKARAPWEQGFEHPVVSVSWEDAQAFCAWLTNHERGAGILRSGEKYRLPTDHEWSCAIGIGQLENHDESPIKKSWAAQGYPWGPSWPPTKLAGNYRGAECEGEMDSGKPAKYIPGYDDGYRRTAPVGVFLPEPNGLYDLSGNVAEWCEDLMNPENPINRVFRGASWTNGDDVVTRSGARGSYGGQGWLAMTGFRIVLAQDS